MGFVLRLGHASCAPAACRSANKVAVDEGGAALGAHFPCGRSSALHAACRHLEHPFVPRYERCSPLLSNMTVNNVQDASMGLEGMKGMDTAERRKSLREALVTAAERAITQRGLAGLKARELAAEAGCAVGAIYNVVADLDELALAVNARTLADLERGLAVAPDELTRGKKGAIARLVGLALAYVDFAAANTQRWRALFEHRLPAGKSLPEWYVEQQARLFAQVEQPLADLRPGSSRDDLALLARTLFSAVHGIVALGLEEKLGVVPLKTLRAQASELVSAIGRGLAR